MSTDNSAAPDTMLRPSPGRRAAFYGGAILVVAVVTFLVAMLLVNVHDRKQEARESYVRLVDLDEDTVDPAVWGQNFPRQYDGYRRTVDVERTKHGGSEAFSHLDQDPRWKRIFAGYGFSLDYREERGHGYMLSDQDDTERVKRLPQPGACLHCHSSIIPAYRKAGGGDVMKGFEAMCAMPYADARPQVSHPVSCVDCHDPKTIQLRVSRPAFLNALRELAPTQVDLPHLPSITQWRKGDRKKDYDPNLLASRQEMRTFVCAQCHVEYYFKGEKKTLTYPWRKGLKAEQIEAYYDEADFKDWSHAETGAPVLKAQHPEFEMWSQGIHARSGVACADCHMPYQREGAVKVSDHHVRSPLLNISRACQTCHRYSEKEILARAEAIQDRTKELMSRAEDALVQMMDAYKAARAAGIPAERLAAAQTLQRKAQWRLDFVSAENSRGFHAPQEAARLLAEAIDYARQAQLEVAAARQK